MIDAPGPWGTGPFTLAEGYSSLDAEQALISSDPFACTFLQREDRTPRVRLEANPHYWDKRRGPRLREVVFRNDVTTARAVDLVCDGEGEVDIVTEVSPADAARVERSAHARLVAVDAARVVVGILNRDAEGLPLADVRARRALNLAIDRGGLVREAMFGRARPLAGLTPPMALTLLHRAPDRLRPYPHDPAQAVDLWRQAGGEGARTLRIAAADGLEPIARKVAADLAAVLGIATHVRLYRGLDAQLEARRRLAERDGPQEWDILIQEQGLQSVDVPPLELHRAVVGETGEYRAGPVVPEFEALYAELVRQTSQARLVRESNRVDRFVRDEALALFLCAPQALYAVNHHVEFTPYATTFELAECRVSPEHWSRRGEQRR